MHRQPQHVSSHYKISLSKIIFIIWLSGVALYSAYILFRHFRFISLLKENAQLLTINQQKMAKNILSDVNLIPLDRIYLSAIISSPMICHVIKSKIYLPDNFFQNYTHTEQKYILQHECVHYQRCDLIANTSMLILICLNWFNPIILFSYRYFRCVQELSCDAMLCQQFSSSEKKAYGYALLKSAFQLPSQYSTMTCWWNTGKLLKERCSMLKYHHSKPIKNFFGLLILATTTSLAIAAPNLEKRDTLTDMKISNSSKNKLSFSIDNICSDEIGVINAHSVKVVSQKRINNACQVTPTHCEAEVYSTANCSGSSIVTLIFDVTGSGVMNIMPHTDSYHIGASSFNLFFDGPWV
jgi:beta-lactamase regulating signal transducer with metallopeptidase domain